MGARDEKKLDLLWKNTLIYFLLGGVFLLGGLLGCIYANGLDGENGLAMGRYLSDYLSVAKENGISPAFWTVLGQRLLLWLCLTVLGLSGIGLVAIPICFGIQGFLLSYSVACFCRLMGTSGLLSGGILFGFPALLWAPAMFVLGIQGLRGAGGLLQRALGDTGRLLPFSRIYWLRIGICAGVMLMCAALECFVVPILLRAAAKVLW